MKTNLLIKVILQSLRIFRNAEYQIQSLTAFSKKPNLVSLEQVFVTNCIFFWESDSDHLNFNCTFGTLTLSNFSNSNF